jgi:hypothetical protein
VRGLWNLAMSAHGAGAEHRETDRGNILPAGAGI